MKEESRNRVEAMEMNERGEQEQSGSYGNGNNERGEQEQSGSYGKNEKEKVLRNADWGWGAKFSGIKRYEGVMFNIISATGGGWVGGVQFPGKKRYVTLEWPLCLK